MKKHILWENGPTLCQTADAPLTMDTVVLADFAQIGEDERGADFGCASGALMLILLARAESLQMTGFELEEKAVSLARMNLEENGFCSRSSVISGDLRTTAALVPEESFDFVISNPPYFPSEQGARSPRRERALAYSGTEGFLEDICRTAHRLCRSGGRLYISWRPDRLPKLLTVMSQCGMEVKRLRFVHHRADYPAVTVLAEGRKDGKPGLAVEPPLLLHDSDGRESGEYRRICRRG